MSYVVFPSLPGLDWNVVKTPMFRTTVKESISGLESRTPLWSYPVWEIEMQYEFLRADVAYTELQTLIGFFLARQGSYDTFNYLDPDDNAVTDQQFAIGDGTTKDFQLARAYQGFLEPVFRVSGTPTIKVNGVTKATPADYTINSEGLVSFVTAPTSTHPITWTGSFYYRVRFADDSADFRAFMKNLWDARKITLRTVK